jgi:hypothetical protein
MAAARRRSQKFIELLPKSCHDFQIVGKLFPGGGAGVVIRHPQDRVIGPAIHAEAGDN